MTSQPIVPPISPVAMPAPQTAPAGADIDPAGLLLIVVGAHLRAEFTDRPLAYRLREAVLRWQDQSLGEDDAPPLRPVVCSDVWYLNAAELAARPVISIGDPQVNAASAMLATRMPTAFVIEN